jgi:hypothetical protein
LERRIADLVQVAVRPEADGREDDAVHPVREPQRCLQRRHPAQAEPEQVGLLDADDVEQPHDVLGRRRGSRSTGPAR